MRSTVSLSRTAVAGVLLVGLVATSGCSWFRKSNELYAQAPENRPLEVPPDLDLPRTDGAMAIPGEPVTASGTIAAAQASSAGTASTAGFNVTGSRDQVFEQVDAALGAIEGVTIASRAKLLGAFDVNYRDSNFLVRVSEAGEASYVSAVDPRGLPATGEAPVQLLRLLQQALAAQ